MLIKEISPESDSSSGCRNPRNSLPAASAPASLAYCTGVVSIPTVLVERRAVSFCPSRSSPPCSAPTTVEPTDHTSRSPSTRLII